MGETEAKSCIKSNPELAYITFEEGKALPTRCTPTPRRCSAPSPSPIPMPR